jgi:hypothetical protein
VSDDISIPPPGTYNPHRHDTGSGPSTLRLAGIALVIVAVAAGGFGLSRLHFRSGEVPVIKADDRPIRVRPDNPGGMQIAGANNDIFSGGNDTDGSKLAPAPEAPNPQALRVPPPAAVPQLAPAVAAPVALAQPALPAPAAAVPPKAKPAVAAAPPAALGKASIQLAALGSEEAARTAWQSLQKRLPDVLAGHRPSISKTERDGKTYWRLRTTGFTDVAQAKSACEKVRAKGGACSVAEF